MGRPRTPAMSPTQVQEALASLAAGHSYRGVATRYGVSVSTIQNHRLRQRLREAENISTGISTPGDILVRTNILVQDISTPPSQPSIPPPSSPRRLPPPSRKKAAPAPADDGFDWGETPFLQLSREAQKKLLKAAYGCCTPMAEMEEITSWSARRISAFLHGDLPDDTPEEEGQFNEVILLPPKG